MKSKELLGKYEVVKVNGDARETIESGRVKNPCQMRKVVDAAFQKHGNEVTIYVYREDDTTLYKEYFRRLMKDGTYTKFNRVKETNRPTTLAKKRMAEKLALQEAVKELKTAEKAEDVQIAEAN